LKTILDIPFLVLVLSIVILWLSLQIGILVAEKWRPMQDEREDLRVIVNAHLTLLALVVGFSFSMAVNRYDQRKNYEEEEANDIGTEYLRAGLLPVADAARLRDLLTQYLDRRLRFYAIHDDQELKQIDDETARLQTEMWSNVQRAALLQPTPPVALIVSGMNDFLSGQGYTQAAWLNRIPAGAWSLMVALAIFSNMLIGYDASRKGLHLFTGLPVAVSVAFFLIADIDSPRHGFILVFPQNLISLSQSLHRQ
jgi:hypothetical protein